MESPPTPPDWAATLRAQGRSISWLAAVIGISRPYLSAVATGRRHASPELAERIGLALHGTSSDRLASMRDYAAERARWREIERQATTLAASIRGALGPDPQ